MNQISFPILTLITFFPLAGVGVLLFVDGERKNILRWVTFVVTLIEFILSIPVFVYFRSGTYQMQFVEKVPWIKSLGINYFLGIDGISLLLVMLTTFLLPVCILASWKYIDKHVKEFMIAMLVMETSMIGAFVALDVILFYIFWEFMLIPMYFLIGVWGYERRIYAAIKFFIYTMVGSVLMLVAILALYFYHHKVTGVWSASVLDFYRLKIPYNLQIWMFLAFALAFAIKVPMWPFHTWLPDAHVEAPTAGSVILAGILLKMGTYGFIRFAMPLFPVAAHKFAPLISTLAIVGIIYGAFVAMVQPDLKKLVAYSSVSHLGYVMLGMFALTMEGVEGSIYQMLNHGISTGALFLIVGMLYERRHTRLIAEFGGLARRLPVLAAFFMIITLSSIGLPGTNGFVGEFLILLGTFKAKPVYAVFAATGVILGAWYMLWMYQRVMFRALTKPENKVLKDLSVREVFVLLPMAAMVFIMGFFPGVFLRKMDASVSHFINRVKTGYVERVETPSLKVKF